MSYNRATKILTIATGSVIFEVGTGPDKLVQTSPHNYVDIVSLTAANGDSVQPDGGDYNIFIERIEGGGFQAINDNGMIDAKRTGGEDTEDGRVLGASFSGPVSRIKVTALNVTIATHARIVVQQHLQ